MASYEQYGTLFKSEDFSDFRLNCNGTIIPVHSVVLATHSPVFRVAMSNRGFREANEGLIDLPADDPAILEKFLSILYRGYYDDVCFEGVCHPHVTTTWSLRALRNILNGTQTALIKDERDDNALYNSYLNNARNIQETLDITYASLLDAFYVYVMADKYQCIIASVIAHDRFRRLWQVYLVDMTTIQCSDQEFQRLVAFIDELYTNTLPHDICRSTLCHKLWDLVTANPIFDGKLKAQATYLVQDHPDHGDDMLRCQDEKRIEQQGLARKWCPQSMP
ncbi:hypothetical protein G7054_g10188 [Neopestalotiopsis clavispora]|nr:hypothetical protein G7054_g10188 [Neopestalotiopsis clavispora]